MMRRAFVPFFPSGRRTEAPEDETREADGENTKIPIVSARVLDQAALAEPGGDVLVRELIDIYNEYYGGMSDAEVRERVIDKGPGSKVVLLYGANGMLGAFGAFRLESIEVEGRKELVFSPGGYSRKAYGGAGLMLMRVGLTWGMRARLRHPWQGLHAVLQCANAAAYRRFAISMARCHPRFDLETPPKSAALLREVRRARGLTELPEPWLIRNPFPVRLREPERIDRSERLRRDPHVAYFREIVPDGDHVLMVHLPLTIENLVASAMQNTRSSQRRLA